MRISSFLLSENISKKRDLQPIAMNGLGEVVALIGKNGSGKSRILDFVKEYANIYDKSDINKSYFSFIPDYIDKAHQSRLKKRVILKQRLDTLSIKLPKTSTENLSEVLLIGQLKSLDEENLKEYHKAVVSGYENSIKTIDYRNVKHIYTKENPSITDLPNLANVISSPPTDLKIKDEFLYVNLSGEIFLNTFADDLAWEDWRAYKGDVEKNKSTLFHRLERLKYYIKHFLNVEITFKEASTDRNGGFKGKILFEGKDLDYDLLSPGQKVLYTYALYFFSIEQVSKFSLSDSIIIIDEPENHLHPEVQVKLISALRAIIKDKGQLWIATHSVHILAHLHFNEIFFVNGGSVTPPGRLTPGRALESLIGLREDLEKMESFLSSVSKWEEINFVIECFTNPQVFATATDGDPEVEVLKGIVSRLDQISILDYGGGKGRLAKALDEHPQIKGKIKSYDLFELKAKDFPELKEIPLIKNIFSDWSEVKGKYDLILLCGVLHEMKVAEWLQSLNQIKNALSEGGILFVIEDLYFPVGENPSPEHGYLVLSNTELMMVVSAPNQLEVLSPITDQHKKRIQGTIIPHSAMISITVASITSAIEALKQRSFKYLKDNKKRTDLAEGRKYAFYSQQHLNSIFALDELELMKDLKTEQVLTNSDKLS